MRILRETEPVSLGIVDLVVSPSVDIIRQWPGAWRPNKETLKLEQTPLFALVPCHPLFPLLVSYPPAH